MQESICCTVEIYRSQKFLLNIGMATKWSEDLVVLGITLPQHKSLLHLVSCLGGLLRSIMHSPSSNDLPRFLSSKGCNPGMFDHWGDNTFYVAAMKGKGDVIDSLLSEIPAADHGHRAYLVTAELVGIKIDRNMYRKSCELLPKYSPFSNASISCGLLVQAILQLKDLTGSRLDVFGSENGYRFNQFCIRNRGNNFGFMVWW